MKLALGIALILVCGISAIGQNSVSETRKFAVIDTEAFYDSVSGITILVTAIRPLEIEFKTSWAYDKKLYEKRRDELSSPFFPVISKALEQFRRENKLEMILGISKVNYCPGIIEGDITRQFIDFFNKNHDQTTRGTFGDKHQ